MGSFKFVGLMFALYIGYVIYAGISYRNSIGRYISYGKAFVHGFVIMAVASLVSLIFGIVLYDVIDPELGGKLSDAIIANTEDTMRNFGAPEEQIDKTIEEMRTTMPENFTIFGRIKGLLTGLIWYAIFVAITSLIVRKNEPVEV
jgi:Na+/H+-dicarboxylate symporter